MFKCKGLISIDIRLYASKIRKCFRPSPSMSLVTQILILITFITMPRSSNNTKLYWRQVKNPSTITLSFRWSLNSKKNNYVLLKLSSKGKTKSFRVSLIRSAESQETSGAKKEPLENLLTLKKTSKGSKLRCNVWSVRRLSWSDSRLVCNRNNYK